MIRVAGGRRLFRSCSPKTNTRLPEKVMSRVACRLLALSFAIGLMSATIASAADEAKKITSVEGITEYRLSNGMKVLLFPDKSKPTVTVNLTIFVGSRHEGYGESGMAHLLEHMVFKGTPTHKDIPKALKERGASFNGTTWLDRTNYYETMPAEGDNLEFALRLEADRMINSEIKASELKKEFSVVRNEFESGENNPRAILDQRMWAVAYEWHNYGKSTIGNKADIERVPVANLKAFYRKYYQPDNAMLVVAGKFDEKKTLGMIQKYFGTIPKPTRKLPKTYTEEPTQDGERIVTLRRVGDVSVVGAQFHVTSGPHPDYAAIAVLEDLMTSSPSGRLYESLVKSKRAASVSGSVYPLHDPGCLQFLATVNESSDPHAVLGNLTDTLDEVAKSGVKKEEVDRAKRRLLKQWELASTNSRRIAIQLSEWAAQGDWRLYFLYRDRLEKVKKADVDRVAKKYIKKSNRTVGLFLPTKQPDRSDIPSTPDIAAALKGYKGRKTLTAGEAFDVSPKYIESRTKRTTLSNGAKAVLLAKKTRGETVTLSVELRYGNVKNLNGQQINAQFLGSMLTRGTKNFTRQQLQDELDKNKVRLSASGSAGRLTISVTTKRTNLPAALTLLREVARRPTFPKSELDIIKRANIAQIQQQMSSPQSLAVIAVRRKLSKYPKGHPRYVPTHKEQVAMVNGVSVESLKNLYDNFLNGRHAVITAVGDFDEKTVLNSLEETLSGWESNKPYKRITDKANTGKGSNNRILTPDKKNAVYFAAMELPLSDSHKDYAALTLGNYILGGGALANRLGVRVRQKEGLSYGVGSLFQASSIDPRGIFYIFAISNPTNMPKAAKAIREEVDKLLKDGITDEELANAKKGYLQSLRVQRASDSSLAGLLSSTVKAKRTMVFYAELEEKIKSTTRAQVMDAVREHLKPGNLHIVMAGDFKAKKKAKDESPKK